MNRRGQIDAQRYIVVEGPTLEAAHPFILRRHEYQPVLHVALVRKLCWDHREAVPWLLAAQLEGRAGRGVVPRDPNAAAGGRDVSGTVVVQKRCHPAAGPGGAPQDFKRIPTCTDRSQSRPVFGRFCRICAAYPDAHTKFYETPVQCFARDGGRLRLV